LYPQLLTAVNFIVVSGHPPAKIPKPLTLFYISLCFIQVSDVKTKTGCARHISHDCEGFLAKLWFLSLKGDVFATRDG
jgi:hypothetical protein